ncbi:hypothetical protein FKV24_000565 [Lysobacter maris]|nr:hypothetical protein [Lysobacter maris]KAB8198694.1 hypothetical protein FKV24_000565 [Lysobacter maris]
MVSIARKLALAAALAAGAGLAAPAAAQDFTFGWNPRSGDVWVDTWLGDMNRYGHRYRDPFIDEMVRYHGAPRSLVVDLLDTRRWAPGDVYIACAIASIIGRPCRYVADVWERDHGRGWGAVAKDLGIKPGSPEFHRLKRGFVPSYDRWGRTITIDADLERDFPGRGRGASQRGHDAQGGNGNGRSSAQGRGNGNGNGQGNRGNGNSGKGKGKDKGRGH